MEIFIIFLILVPVIWLLIGIFTPASFSGEGFYKQQLAKNGINYQKLPDAFLKKMVELALSIPEMRGLKGVSAKSEMVTNLELFAKDLADWYHRPEQNKGEIESGMGLNNYYEKFNLRECLAPVNTKVDRIAGEVIKAFTPTWNGAFLFKKDVPSSTYNDPYILGFVYSTISLLTKMQGQDRLNTIESGEIICKAQGYFLGEESLKTTLNLLEASNKDFMEGVKNSQQVVMLTCNLTTLEKFCSEFKDEGHTLEQAKEASKVNRQLHNSLEISGTDEQAYGSWLLVKYWSQYIQKKHLS